MVYLLLNSYAPIVSAFIGGSSTVLWHPLAVSFAVFKSHWGLSALWNFADRLVLFLKFGHMFCGPKT